MKVNRLVVAAAFVYGAAGLALLFTSELALDAAGVVFSSGTEWLAQIAAGGLLALAWLNWLQRFSPMGGVLGRPLLLANLMFTSVTFFASARAWLDGDALSVAIAAGLAGALMIGFAMRLFSRAAP